MLLLQLQIWDITQIYDMKNYQKKELKLMEIDWTKIKDGFRGFEKLALIFVKDQFRNPSWEKTSETRDGNKDAVAYVFGYRSSKNKQTEWWMEAKYSTEKTVITRYRLDATIVSAILNENVNKVIFVTNVSVRAKTIIDIRNALTKSTCCSEVAFCTKPVLEDWICKNNDVYEAFFPTLNRGEKLKHSEKIFLTQEIDFYSKSSNSVIFAEPCKNLQSNTHYVGFFSVYSEYNKTVTLKKSRYCKGISLIGKREFTLHAGDNLIKFEFAVLSNPPEANTFFFLLDDIEVFPAYSIHFLTKSNIHYELPGQIKIIDKLKKSLRQFLIKNQCEYYAISAASGSGKTEILEQLSSDSSLNNEYLFYRSFSFSDIENSLIIVDLILFILFPYLSPDEIDEAYIHQLSVVHIIERVYKLIQLRTNYNELINFFIQECTPEEFLPNKMKVNARIIYIDNVHLLSDPLFNFFKKLVFEIQKRKIPVFMVVTIDTINPYQERCLELFSCCNIELYRFQLSIEDIIAVMGGSLQVKKTASNILQSGCLTILELFSFAKYISSESYVIETTEQLLSALRIFQYSDIFGKELRAKFINLFNQYPKIRVICDDIFSCYSPVKGYEDSAPELNALIEKDLIRYNMHNCIVPRNEFIRDYYVHYFGIQKNQSHIYTSKEDYLRAQLENENAPSILHQAAKAFIDLTNNKQFNSVVYIGKNIFEYEPYRIELENRIQDRVLFLQIYFSYSYAAHMQSNVNNPRIHFECIIKRCQQSINPQLLMLCLRAQWEQANNDFENLQYTNVLEDIVAGIETLKKIQMCTGNKNDIKEQLKFHDFMAIKCFVESELGTDNIDVCDQRMKDSIEYGFVERYHNTQIRLALTKITNSTYKSLCQLKEGIQYFKEKHSGEHKMYYFGEFSLLYYEMVINDKPSIIKSLTEVHEKMKTHQHNNYRKRNFAMATYYYWLGDIETGNHYLFSEIFMMRNLSKRTKGFYYETMALYQLRIFDVSQAKASLEQALNSFSDIESYSNIINHNIALLDKTSLKDIKIAFWKGEEFDSNTYYLDFRITW